MVKEIHSTTFNKFINKIPTSYEALCIEPHMHVFMSTYELNRQ